MSKAGALTVLIESMAGLFSLVLFPLFEIKFPKDIKVYIFLGLAIIFYTIQDRLGTTVRSGIEASAYNIIKQLSNVFMIIAGLIFFKEPFVLNKIIGALLIIVSNVLVFSKNKRFKIDRYISLGIIANLCFTVALFIDVNYSEQFNLPFYVALTLLIPALLIFLIEKIQPKDIMNEFKNVDKKNILITSLSWGLMLIAQLRAYQLGKVTVITPLCSLTVIINVIVGYLFLKERDNLFKKILASILVIISVILITL